MRRRFRPRSASRSGGRAAAGRSLESDLLCSPLAKKSGWTKHKDCDEEREIHDLAERSVHEEATELLHDADEKATNDCSRQATESTQHHDHERDEHEVRPHCRKNVV